MSSTKFKVPSSDRRHIKIEQFSQFVSASRLRQVQNLLHKDNEKQVDGILCIAGIDSRYNECMYELLNYVLFGFFDARRSELDSSGFAEEVIDDFMILIRPSHVEIYCNPVNYHYLLPYISHWPSLQFHCLADNEYEGEDDDASEEFKIRSLIAMVKECKVIGLPFSGKGQNTKFDVMAVEKWPIIQAYALDEFDGGGFFTMNFEVVDISAGVHQLNTAQDPATMEMLLTEHYPLMSRQWSNMMQCIQMSLDSSSAFISQKKVSEPLKSYFNHGLVGQKRSQGKVPFVVFGADSMKHTLERVQKGEILENPKDLVIKKETASHMICQVVSPNNPLVCSRTYFFCPKAFSATDDSSGDSSLNNALRYSSTVYLSMIRAVLAAIEMYAHTANYSKAEKKCRETLCEECSLLKNKNLDQYISGSSQVVFSLIALGIDDSSCSVEDATSSKWMKCVGLTLYDIPPLDGSSPLGSMVFSETFLDSRLVCEGSTDVSSDYLILTSSIPRYRLWSLNGHSKKHTVSAPNLPSERWGEMLMTQPDIPMVGTWPALLPAEKVGLAVWQNGISVLSFEYGSFNLHGSEVKSVSLYDGDSMSQVSMLVFQVAQNGPLSSRLPPHLLADVDEDGFFQLVFAFMPHTKAHIQLYGSVLPAWKNKTEIPPVERLEFLDPAIEPIHFYLQNKLEIITSSEGTSSALKKVGAELPDLYGFLDHLTETCGMQGPVSQDVFTTLTGNIEEPHGNIGEKITVTIIGGTPGSEKETMASVLISYNKNIINWLVYKQPDECKVDIPFLHRSMISAVETRNQWLLTKSTRVILIAPGFCDITEVVRAIACHPDPAIRTEFSIGTVTVCIDPLNAFIEHKMLLPCITSQCAQGWVNNIVFTAQTLAPSALLDDIQTLIRRINTNVALLKAEGGNIRRSTDLDLIMSETAFNHPDMRRARVLLKPNWCNTAGSAWPARPPMKDVVLRFTIPLEKHLTLIKLRALKGSLKGHPFVGNIYFVRGYLAFNGSPTLVDLQFTPLNNKLSINETGQSGQGEGQVYFMCFTGVGLDEKNLKSLLSSCVKQKPEKKKLLTRNDLSEKDIEKIHVKHHLDELPDGWFYNGSQFVSMAGDRSLKHPSLDRFIEEYLDQKNAEIVRFNARIDTEAYVDLWK